MVQEKTCVVTGCAGFVGSHLCEALLRDGHHVVGVDNFFSGYRKNMKSFLTHPRFVFYEKDIRDKELVSFLFREHPFLSVFFHLAAIVSVPYSLSHAQETLDVNYSSSLQLYEGAMRNGVGSFVFAGSAAEYGDTKTLPVAEDDLTDDVRQSSPYGRAKYLLSHHIESTNFGSSLRFFNIYGPRQDPSSPYSGVISKFIDMGRSGDALTIFGDGRQTRDFIYVQDVVQAYLRAAGISKEEQQPLKGVYNVGTGRENSICSLAELIKSMTGNSRQCVFLPERQGDIRYSVANVSKFKNSTHFLPEVPLRQGLQDLLNWPEA